MKILFVASINQKNKSREQYLNIINIVRKLGHSIICDHVLKFDSKDIDSMSHKENLEFHQNILEKMVKVDLIIAEISHESISVGFLINEAMKRNKRVIAASCSKETPNLLITLEKSEMFSLLKYKDFKDLEKNLQFYLDDAKRKFKKRFNLFISGKLDLYLQNISKKNNVSKSEYLRNLIKEDMSKNKSK